MRLILLALMCGPAVPAAAQPDAPYTAARIAEALEVAPCGDGQSRGEEGLCPAADQDSRGFNLGARGGYRRRSSISVPLSKGDVGSSVPSAQTAAALLSNLRITFEGGSAELTAEGRARAMSFATAIQMPSLLKRRFEIAGHTDTSGSRAGNLLLSTARAQAVVDYMVTNGVERSRLEARGYGSADLAFPMAPRDPANRRVEARSLN